MSPKAQRGGVKSSVTRIDKFLKSLGAAQIENPDVRRKLKAKLELLHENKEKLLNIHEEIVAEEGVNIEEEENVREEILESIDDLDTYIRLLLLGEDDSNEKPEKSPDTDESSKSSDKLDNFLDKFSSALEKISLGKSSDHDASEHVKLQPIFIPTFAGTYQEWPTFKDIFLTTIGDSKKLPDAHKMQYLLTYLSGEAKQTVQHMKICDSNYSAAWSLLSDKYDDQCALINDNIQRFLAQPNIKASSEASVRQFRTTCNSILHSLDSLKATGRDIWLVHWASKRLDSESMTLWAREIKNKVPTWDLFDTFLSERAKTLAIYTPPIEKPTSYKSQGSQKGKQTTTSLITTDTPTSCDCCKEDAHKLFKCSKFASLTPSERYEFVKVHNLCRNCLGKNHITKECKSSTCKKCHTKHSTMLHEAFPVTPTSHPHENQKSITDAEPTAPNAATKDPPIQPTVAISSSVLSSHAISKVFLATAMVEILDKENKVHHCRAVLDSGAQMNLMTEELSQKLKLNKSVSSVIIRGVTNSQSVAKHQAETTVRSRVADFHLNFTSLIVPKITGNLPNWEVDTQAIPIPRNITLADPSWDISRPIDILIGAEHYGDIVKDESIKLGSGLPQLKNTDFGWTIMGPHKVESSPESNNSLECCLTTLTSLNKTVKKFFEVEQVPSNPPLTQEHLEVEQQFSDSTVRDTNGRYMVQLPLRPTVENLADNKANAIRQFLRLEKRLNHNPQLKEEYSKSIHQYLEQGFLEPIPKENVSQLIYYIPHHPVIKESSSTTKVRVVYNASSRSSTGLSLNDVLKTGPTVQPQLVETLANFRRHPVALSADIRQMYPQFLLDPQHRDLQRIIWRDSPSDPITEYRLTGVSFGLGSSSFLATRSLNQLATDEQQTYPKASEALLRNFYVDDCLLSCETIEEALETQQQLIGITQSAGLTLTKWCSNRKELLQVSNDSPNAFLDVPEHTVSTLGMKWDAQRDVFHYEGSMDDSKATTKREILSVISRLFDPEGFLSPIIVRGKMLFQSLWAMKLQWDDELPASILSEWETYEEDLKGISSITIPRWASTIQSPVSEELHVFCAASEGAYGAALYYVTENHNGRSSHLLFAKSKVAPLDPLNTTDRMQLLAAELGQLIMEKFRKLYNITNCHYWTDSTAVYYQIQSTGLKFEIFVAHRIAYIHALSNRNDWHHISADFNPATIISNGSTVDGLRLSSLWWHGAPFLIQRNTQWPQCNLSIEEQTILLAPFLESDDDTPKPSLDCIERLISETSNYSELIDSLVIAFRWFSRAKKGSDQTVPPSASEIIRAERALIKWDQQHKLSHVFTAISNGTIHSNQGLKSIKGLAPFIDEEGLIRVGGRTSQSDEPYDTRFPILLPKGELARMIATHEHRKHFHPGPQLLLSNMRQRLWPLGARKLTRDAVKCCVRCTRCKPRMEQQFMGDLPRERVTFHPPFFNTGVDYCGPVWIRPDLKRGGTPRKAYICVFVCFTTKAVHFELVSDLTSEGFIAALRRFAARRSAPLHIFSDNATNFTAADKELRSLLECETVQRELSAAAASLGITWHFQPPRAPHHGGLWESAVKSLKHHLIRTVGDKCFTYEEFYTILVQIEGILNSRPLTPLTDDPSEPSPLTPGHFLTPGRALTELPNPDLQELPMNRLNRHQLCQHIVQCFARRWKMEYLTQLQKRTKWFAHIPNLKTGDLVIIYEDNSPSHRWPLGVIQEVHPGKDARVRVVTVRTSKGLYKRSVHKICRLPSPDEDECASANTAGS